MNKVNTIVIVNKETQSSICNSKLSTKQTIYFYNVNTK